jgi:hypothetical protein
LAKRRRKADRFGAGLGRGEALVEGDASHPHTIFAVEATTSKP